MKIRFFIVLALTLMAVSACVVEPVGGGYYHGGDGGYNRGGGWNRHDEGRRVWR